MVLGSLGSAAAEWVGLAETKFIHSAAPLPLEDVAGAATDLLQVCEHVTPPCRLNPLLFNGHLQTMWTAAKPHGPAVHYRRRVFEADHSVYSGTFAVDFVVPAQVEPDQTGAEGGPDLPPRTALLADDEFGRLGGPDGRPQLVVLHGLSGGSHEVYLRHAIEPLVRSGRWEVCVVNSRGCAMSSITSGVLYNARATWDIRQTVKWLHRTFPNRPLFGLGFSLGANILTNYVAEEGSECLFKAAVVCSNPFNLEISSKVLQSSLIGREVYLRVMGSSMHELAHRHKKELQTYTNLDWEVIEKIKYLHDFDREVQCKTWGYPTEYAYYRDASSADSVLVIRIPFFAIHAVDDPIAVEAAIPYEEFQQNPCTVLCTTSMGGHLSWFEPGGGRWYVKPVCNFLNHMAFSINLDKVQPLPSSVREGRHGHHYEPMRRRMEIREDE